MAQRLLEGEVVYSHEESTDELRAVISHLRSELRDERNKRVQIEAGVNQLRVVLDPLHRALQMIFGELEHMGVQAPEAPSAPTSAKRAVWESWKQKLGGKQAEFIDALLTHGAMTAQQLKIATKSGQQTVYDVIHKLNKTGLINKNGGKYTLKEL